MIVNQNTVIVENYFGNLGLERKGLKPNLHARAYSKIFAQSLSVISILSLFFFLNKCWWSPASAQVQGCGPRASNTSSESGSRTQQSGTPGDEAKVSIMWGRERGVSSSAGLCRRCCVTSRRERGTKRGGGTGKHFCFGRDENAEKYAEHKKETCQKLSI